MIKTVILDFDGTIADTSQCIFQTVRATLAQLGLPTVSDESIRPLIGLPLRENFIQGAGITDPRLVDRCVETYRLLFDDIADTTARLFPGVADTLETLHRQGYTTAIASSRGRDSLHWFLRKFGIGEYISLVFGDEDITEKKPAPEMVLRILSQTHTDATEALVVGDTTFDIEMGQRAGCLTCGVSYGNHSRQRLLAQGADHVVDRFADLLSILHPQR